MFKEFWSPLVAGLAILVLVLSGCTPVAPTEGVSPLTPPPADSGAQPGAPEEDATSDIVAEVRRDLAERVGISPDLVSVVLVAAVEWPDASLGCPQPGMEYAQVITPGFRVVLEAEGEEYVYHTGEDRFVLCKQLAGDGSDTVTPAIEIADLPPNVQELVEKARVDLSKRLDISVVDISLESVEAVEWRDSSLGCPKPGVSYLQVITPGYRLRLQAGGQLYEYHTDEQNVVYCDKVRPAGERLGGKEQLVDTAKEDLAERLDVPVREIQMVSADYVEWPDASLGCPQPGMMYAQVITPGYRIILSASGQNYEYHTSLRGVTLCER
jgi:hypothetical protein